jgi:hypothetical protein
VLGKAPKGATPRKVILRRRMAMKIKAIIRTRRMIIRLQASPARDCLRDRIEMNVGKPPLHYLQI